MLGQFGGLASLAGVNLGGGANNDTEVSLAVLRSREFTEAFIRDRNLLPLIFEECWDADANRWKGDKEELRQLCDDAVYESFASAIDARLAAGETLDNRLVRIEESTISDAEYRAPMARITVRFRSDIAAVTRDAAGNVVAGSLNDAVEAIEVWTFARDIGSADPDWLLEETDEG